MRFVLFLALAAALTAYAFWVYLRVDLHIPGARRLAVLRASVLVVILLLLFDPRIPEEGRGTPTRWALLDASLSMGATGVDGSAAWSRAAERAETLRRDGWRVVRFGGEELTPVDGDPGTPDAVSSRLLPALQSAAEAGAREVRILSDGRIEDAVSVRAALAALPVDVVLERFGDEVANAGISRFRVPDLPRPDATPVAEVEVFGGAAGDSVDVEVLEEGSLVASTRIPTPSPGLRATVSLELPPPGGAGRVRYAARVSGSDGYADDDEAVAYASVGFEEGGLVLVSFRPDWEPRYLLPVLEEVTGLSASGFLRAGDDRWVRLGPAADRGAPADSATVRVAASEAAVLVVHGLNAEAAPWIDPLLAPGGRLLAFPSDAEGAARLGIRAEAPRTGEWYASADVPASPVAGALAGVDLQGLPPLADVLVPATPDPEPVLQLQLRGAGLPVPGFDLDAGEGGRRVVALSSGFWRWAARPEGRGPYRTLWSGLAGWLLGGERTTAASPRPVEWVVSRGSPVEWRLPGGEAPVRIVIAGEDDEAPAVDTVVAGGAQRSIGVLPPATYVFSVLDESSGDTLSTGRFDVAATTAEMLPAVADLEPANPGGGAAAAGGGGRPLRTHPLPYLLLIAVLCGEWIIRRRSGLR